MNERSQERQEKYQRVRTDFDKLDTEEKVVFLLEAAVSTVARGIDQFGRAVSDEINKAFSKRAERKAHANGDAAAPEGEAAGPADESAEGESGETSEETL